MSSRRENIAEQQDLQPELGALNEVAVLAPASTSAQGTSSQKTSKSRSLLPTRKNINRLGKKKVSSTTAKESPPSSPRSTARPSGHPDEPASSAAEPHVREPAAGHEGSLTTERNDRVAQQTPESLLEKHEQQQHEISNQNPRTRIPLAKRFEEKDRSGHEFSKVATKIYTVGYLVLFSILGVLARLGLQTLTVYPGAPVQQGLVWANFAGSFVMGFLAEDRKLFRHEWGGKPISQVKDPARDGGDDKNDSSSNDSVDSAAEKKRHGAVKKTIPLFVGLSTGFCGSCTSFSSFQRDVFLVLANSAPSPETEHVLARNGGYSFLAVLASLIITPALSLAALQAGAHVALFAERWTPSLNFYFVRGFLDPVASFVGFGAWLGAVLMAIWPPDRPHGPAAYYHETWAHETWRGQAVFALVFAPLGTLLRFYASLLLNPRFASFPLGTFAVNIFGTLMEGVFYDLQHARLLAAARVGGGRVGCQVLQGMQDGFCGCVTTVSTWVAELKGLRRSSSYVYGLVSLAVGVGVMVIVMGSLRWTHGFLAPQCVT